MYLDLTVLYGLIVFGFMRNLWFFRFQKSSFSALLALKCFCSEQTVPMAPPNNWLINTLSFWAQIWCTMAVVYANVGRNCKHQSNLRWVAWTFRCDGARSYIHEDDLYTAHWIGTKKRQIQKWLYTRPCEFEWTFSKKIKMRTVYFIEESSLCYAKWRKPIRGLCMANFQNIAANKTRSPNMISLKGRRYQ